MERSKELRRGPAVVSRRAASAAGPPGAGRRRSSGQKLPVGKAHGEGSAGAGSGPYRVTVNFAQWGLIFPVAWYKILLETQIAAAHGVRQHPTGL